MDNDYMLNKNLKYVIKDLHTESEIIQKKILDYSAILDKFPDATFDFFRDIIYSKSANREADRVEFHKIKTDVYNPNKGYAVVAEVYLLCNDIQVYTKPYRVYIGESKGCFECEVPYNGFKDTVNNLDFNEVVKEEILNYFKE